MKKRKILLGISLIGFITGCGAPKTENNDNSNQQEIIYGEDGENGRSIKSISLTSREGNIDIYTITYTDDTTSTFKVVNGKDGIQGIKGEPGIDGVAPTIEMGSNGNWIINGSDTGISIKGSQGEKGETGNGIEKIELTKSEGNIDTYTIYFTDGSSMEFNITNGTNGEQGVQGEVGENGKSAFEVFKEHYPEYIGSEEDWINDVINGNFDRVAVTFDANGGALDCDETLTIRKGENFGNSLPIPEKKGKTFLGWFTGWDEDDFQVNKATLINSNLNLIAKWDSYEVNFMSQHGAVLYSQQVKHGEKANRVEDIPETVCNTHTFVDWNFNFDNSITSDTEIYSIWKENEGVIMFFGSYPQSLVSEESLKKELSLLENGNVSGAILEHDFDKDGFKEKYLCYESKRQLRSDVGDKIKVGINYFKFEPIEWRILSKDSDSYFLVSNRVLDAESRATEGYKRYNRIIKKDEVVYNDYEVSFIRSWLNDYFLNAAFDIDEQNKILKIKVDNSLESAELSEDKLYICSSTNDKIYLLSTAEVHSHISEDDSFKEYSIANATDYAKSKITLDDLSTDRDTFGNCSWWLRSPINYPTQVQCVTTDGRLGWCMRTSINYGIRPAMRIML